MKHNITKGEPFFITFEGIDGSGKTTQAKMLAEYLSNEGFQVVLTNEPGGTKFGKHIRELVLKKRFEVTSLTELFMFLADRSDHMDKIIIPALAEGKIVICDRFIDSSVAYQGYGMRMDVDTINYLNAVAIRGIAPDLVIYLNIPVDLSLERQNIRNRKKDKFEELDRDFYYRILEGYQTSIRNNWIVKDGSKTESDIFESIKQYINGLRIDAV